MFYKAHDVRIAEFEARFQVGETLQDCQNFFSQIVLSFLSIHRRFSGLDFTLADKRYMLEICFARVIETLPL
jgi:hypothetical protein